MSRSSGPPWPSGIPDGAAGPRRHGGGVREPAGRAVDQLLDELAADADLTGGNGRSAVYAHTLRHTFASSLLRSGVDVVTVAELIGHRRLDTIRQYTLPTAADLEAAVATLPADQ